MRCTAYNDNHLTQNLDAGINDHFSWRPTEVMENCGWCEALVKESELTAFRKNNITRHVCNKCMNELNDDNN